MHEILVNIHNHTNLSDGHATFSGLARSAISSGLDVVITNDHNAYLSGVDGYYGDGDHRVLLLAGQEIHDQALYPSKNHLLVLFPAQNYSSYAANSRDLLKMVHNTGGLTFLAHPVENELKAIHEQDFSWVNWDIGAFTGLELWNGLSEIKNRCRNLWQVVFYVFFPNSMPKGPLPETLHLWDSLLRSGSKCVAVGGSDSHALPKKLLAWTKTVYPYTYHFRSINNHLLIEKPLSGDPVEASRQVHKAFSSGSLFIGYDRPHPTRGFSFTASGCDRIAQIGETVNCANGLTLSIHLPAPAECILLRDGKQVKKWTGKQICAYITRDSGIYRVEAYINYLGERRGWIFSNPIYARDHAGK